MAAVAGATVCAWPLTRRSVFKETAGKGVLSSKVELGWQSQGGSGVVGLERVSALGKIWALLIPWSIVAITDPVMGQGIAVLC